MRTGFLEGFFPRGCLLCGLPLSAHDAPWGICEACDEGLPRIEGQRCGICGKPLVSEIENCLRCRNSAFHFESNRSALLYIEGGRSLIQAYKFNQERHLEAFVDRLLIDIFNKLEKMPDIIVPVPPLPSKAKKRGWDPVALMSRAVSRGGIPLLDLLGKRKGKEQKSLDFEGRMANIKGRFFIREKLPRDSDCLLIDDVFTTGATVSECSRLLKENGAARVRSLTLALDP
jgi:competence protein ComFC